MQKSAQSLKAIKLVGITARTNNLSEGNPATAKIGQTLQKYFYTGLPEKIQNRKQPGRTFGVYTDYESDFMGNYTYFIGEEVEDFGEIPEGMTMLTIPEQSYTKFTAGPGPIPAVFVESWQKIWTMSSKDLGGERAYHTDFEIYDERALNPLQVVFDIYIGLKA